MLIWVGNNPSINYIIINYANLQRNTFPKLYRNALTIQELKFNNKNLNETSQQEALLKYKRNVSTR